MSLERVTELLDEKGFGIHRSRLARIETGETSATVEDVYALAFVLDTSPANLVVPEPDTLKPGEKLKDEPGVKLLGRADEPGEFRAWVNGETRLGDQKPDLFELQRPLPDLLKQFPTLSPSAVREMTARQIATYRPRREKKQ